MLINIFNSILCLLVCTSGILHRVAEEIPVPTLSTVLKSGELTAEKVSGAQFRSEDSEVYRFLSSLDIFSKLSEKELRTLATSCRFQSFESGAYLAYEGDDHTSRGFVVAKGRVALLKTSLNGKEFIVELLSPRNLIGLALTLPLRARDEQLSARAQTPTKVLWVPKESFIVSLDHHTPIFRELIGILVDSLQSSFRLSRGLAHDRVEIRIAAVLLTLALKFARTPAVLKSGATDVPTIDITRQQLADLTGTTNETAIRVTRAMQRAGMIDIKQPGVVRVLSLPDLQKLAEGESVIQKF